MSDVKLWEKYNLTIREASAYFNICEKKLRQMIKEEGCRFVIYNGKKALIKRIELEKYLDTVKCL